ncbi:tetratricopeptide repeat-containing sensor histidine kinase [Algibacter mikhailovii]|uniref:tetratricopeptide repeat-containing sensor histidine kinase n=1 Tax=Algibacter mikhailovii TaxID=425498 RepID=UPI002494444A|nr:tetratricopeptide repeat protein [Algibacter mikhailovii]
MKFKSTSFLFFCLLVCHIIGLISSKGWAQSDLEYYKVISELKNMDSVGMALVYFKTQSKKALQKQDSIKAAYYIELMAYGQFKMGFPLESEVLGINALSILDGVKDSTKTKDARKRLFNHLGMVYRSLKDVANARNYYERALRINSSKTDRAAIISNIANLYADGNDYEKAVKILGDYYDEVLTLPDSAIKATYLNNYGSFRSKFNPSEGLRLMEQALEMRLILKDLSGLFGSYEQLSLFYLENGDLKKANYYYVKLKEVTRKIESPAYHLKAAELRLKLEKNPDVDAYIALSDEVNYNKQQRVNKFAAIKYGVEEKEKLLQENQHKLELSELKQAKEKSYKLLYMAISVFGALLTVLLLFLLKSRHKKEKIRQVYLTETRISKKVHDEVANDVYQLMTKLQGSHPKDDETIIDELEGIYNKTRDISKENNTLDLTEHFDVLIKDLLMGYSNEQVNVITKNLNKINWEVMPDLNKMTLYRVLQELMTNMKKHSKANIVVIGFEQIKHKTQIEYKDNGVGCALSIKGGLQNTENRMASINGSINFESSINKGFKAVITI